MSTVTKLPPEIWVHVLKSTRTRPRATELKENIVYRYDYDSLKAWCLVSEYFRSLAQPLLFEYFRIFVFGWGSGDLQTAGIEQLFKDRPESTKWIKELKIYQHFTDQYSSNQEDYISTFTAIARVIRCLADLRSFTLAIGADEVPSATETLLGALSKDIHSSLRFLSLEYNHPINSVPSEVHAITLPTLKKLSLAGSGTRNAFHVLQGDQCPGLFGNITSLILSDELESGLLEHIKQMTVFPALTELAATLEGAKQLAPGRPIRRLRIELPPEGPPATVDSILPIIKQIKTLQALCLLGFDWESDMLERIAEAAPDLTELRLIGVLDASFVVLKWLKKHLRLLLSGFPVLESVAFTHATTSGYIYSLNADRIELYQEILRTIQREHPIAQVQFGPSAWRIDASGEWVHFYSYGG